LDSSPRITAPPRYITKEFRRLRFAAWDLFDFVFPFDQRKKYGSHAKGMEKLWECQKVQILT
jgi:hypothetical protein